MLNRAVARAVPILIYRQAGEDGLWIRSVFVVRPAGLVYRLRGKRKRKIFKGMTHRPPTTGQYTSDNQGHWKVFWHVCGSAG